MSGFIVFSDGRAWTSSNGAFDALLEAIVAVLPSEQAAVRLGQWLLTQRSCVLGPGMGTIDLRTLTPRNQHLFLSAARQVCSTEPLPAVIEGWPEKMRLIIRMLASLERGEPPSACNPDMRDVIPPTSQQLGPGWNDDEL